MKHILFITYSLSLLIAIPVFSQTETNELFTQITAYYNQRAELQDSASLNELSLLMAAALETNLLAPADKTTTNGYQTTIKNDLQIQTAAKQAIEAAMQKTTFDEKVTAFNEIITNATGKTYINEIYNKFAEALSLLFQSRTTTNNAQLQKLLTLLNASIASTLLADAQKTFITTNLITKVTAEIASTAGAAPSTTLISDTLAAIDAALKKATADEQITALALIVTNAAGKTFTIEVYQKFANALNTLFQGRKTTDKVQLQKILDLLNAGVASSLLDSSQKAVFLASFISTLTSDIAKASATTTTAKVDATLVKNTIKAIDAAVKQKTFDKQVTAFAKIITGATGKTYDKSVYDKCAAALNTIFKNRTKATKKQLQAFLTVLQNVAKSSLLTSTQKKAITKTTIPALNKDIAKAK